MVIFAQEFFLVLQGQYFLANSLAVLFRISGGSETNSKFGWEVRLVGGIEKLRKKLLMLKLSLAKL